jgi:hypothetical protein
MTKQHISFAALVLFASLSATAYGQGGQVKVCKGGVRPNVVVVPLVANVEIPAHKKGQTQKEWDALVEPLIKSGKATYKFVCPEDLPGYKPPVTPTGPSLTEQVKKLQETSVTTEVYKKDKDAQKKVDGDQDKVIAMKADKSDLANKADKSETDKLWDAVGENAAATEAVAKQACGTGTLVKESGVWICTAKPDNSAAIAAADEKATRALRLVGKGGRDGEDGGGYYLSVAPLMGGMGSEVFSMVYAGGELGLMFDNLGQTVAFAVRGGVQINLDTEDYPISTSIAGGPNFRIISPKVRGESGIGINGLSIGQNLDLDATKVAGYFRLGYNVNKVLNVFGEIEAGTVFSELNPDFIVGGKAGASFTLVRFQGKGSSTETPKQPSTPNNNAASDGPLQRR